MLRTQAHIQSHFSEQMQSWNKRECEYGSDGNQISVKYESIFCINTKEEVKVCDTEGLKKAALRRERVVVM